MYVCTVQYTCMLAITGFYLNILITTCFCLASWVRLCCLFKKYVHLIYLRFLKYLHTYICICNARMCMVTSKSSGNSVLWAGGRGLQCRTNQELSCYFIFSFSSSNGILVHISAGLRPFCWICCMFEPSATDNHISIRRKVYRPQPV